MMFLLRWSGFRLVAAVAVAAACSSSAMMAHERYIVVVRSPGRGMSQENPASINAERFEEVVGRFPRDRSARIQVGLGFIFSPFRTAPATTARALENFLAAAEATNTPIVIHLDLEQWWGARPDLWNWWDKSRPGFDPANRANVEWTDWSPEDAVKIAWRNWGRQIRVLPPPNLSSPRYRDACREELRRLVPIIVQWYRTLPEDKKSLLIAVKVGHESSIGVNAYHYPGGNVLLDQPAANDPVRKLDDADVLARGMQQIGYAAVKTAGLRDHGAITEQDLVEATRRYLEFLCRETAACGVPRDRLFSHGAGWTNGEAMYDAAVNAYASPGWSFYRHAANPLAEPAVVRNLARSDAPYWAAAEWLLVGKHTRDEWAAALRNTLADRRARFLCIFNWEGIRDDTAALNAIRDVAGGGSSEKRQTADERGPK